MAWKNYKRHYHNRRIAKNRAKKESNLRYLYSYPDAFEYFGDEKLAEAVYVEQYPTYTRVFVPNPVFPGIFPGRWQYEPDGGTRPITRRKYHYVHNLLTQEEFWELEEAQLKRSVAVLKKRVTNPWSGWGVKSSRRRGDTIFGGNRNLDRKLFIQGKRFTEEEFEDMNLSGWHGCSYWD